VLAFFKDVLGSNFRPFSDIVVSELYKFKIDLLARKLKKERLAAKAAAEDGDGDAPVEEPIKSESDAKEVPTEKKPVEPAPKKTESQKRADFIFHSICLQIHMEGKQGAKGYFEQFDAVNRGYVNLRDFTKVILGPYRVMCLASDLKVVAERFNVESDDPVQPEYVAIDSFDAYKHDYQSDDARIRVDYREFIKAVTRPFVLEVAKVYTGMPVTAVLSTMLDSLVYVASINRVSLSHFYQTQVEADLNNVKDFEVFYDKIFNEKLVDDVKLDYNPEIANTVFNNTFMATGTDFYDTLSADANEQLNILYPRKVYIPVENEGDSLPPNSPKPVANTLFSGMRKAILEHLTNIDDPQNL
jgi:hypothetical protein